MIESLIEAVRPYAPEKVFFACDGPKENVFADETLVNQVRDLAKRIDWACELQTSFSESNLGLRERMSSAISWFFRSVESGAILEDDCIPNEEFFEFVRFCLSEYRNDPTVWGISGSNTSGVSDFGNASFGAIRIPLIWGWATWQDRWKEFGLGTHRFLAFQRGELEFTWPDKLLKSALEWQILRNPRNNVNSWAYQWAWIVVSNYGLWIVPGGNSVRNIGFGNRATNTSGTSPKYGDYRTVFPIRSPRELTIMPDLEEKILRKTHRAHKSAILTLARDIVRTTKLSLAKISPNLRTRGPIKRP